MARQTRMLSIMLMLVMAGTAAGQWFKVDKISPTPPTVTIVSNTAGGTTIDVLVHGFWRDTCRVGDTVWDKLSIPGTTTADLTIGRPQVPSIPNLLGIPDNAQVALSVQVLGTQVFDSLLCYPYQGDLNDSSPLVLDTAFYGTSARYPDSGGAVLSTGKWRTLSVAGIQTYPLRYVPSARQVVVLSHYRILLTYTGGAYSYQPIEPWIGALYARYVDNFSQLGLPTLGAENAGYKCLVLLNSNLGGSVGLLHLVQWDSLRGIPTEVVPSTSWSPDLVKSTIVAKYNTHEPGNPPTLRWVVLVGTPEDGVFNLPMKMYEGHVGDYWYSDLECNGYPEVGITRLAPTDLVDPAHAQQDLTNQCERILNYETTSVQYPEDPNWVTRMLLVAHGGGGKPRFDSVIQSVHDDPNYNYYEYSMNVVHGLTEPDGQGNLDVRAQLASPSLGTGVVLYRGHGLSEMWEDWTRDQSGNYAMDWTDDWVNGTTLGNATPVVYNVCCQNGNRSATSLSRTWMHHGAVASLAAVEDIYDGPANAMSRTLVRSTSCGNSEEYPCPIFDIGGILCNVDADLTRHGAGEVNPGIWEDARNMCYFLGYPSMQVWSGGVAQDPTVDFPPVIPCGWFTMPVHVAVDSGRPVANALVCVWKKDAQGQATEFYVTATTNASGDAVLPIHPPNPVTPGQFQLTVSDGHAAETPHTPIRPLTLQGQAQPDHVVLHSDSVSDDPPGGDGNGQAGPGETFHVHTWVKNDGTTPVQSVNALIDLEGSDPWVLTPHGGVETYGDIQPGATAQWQHGYPVFTISPDCPPGHMLHLRATIQSSSGGPWYSDFTIPVDVGLPANVDQSATFPTQARHLVRRPNSEELHVVYQKPDAGGLDSVWYQKSQDGGVIWSREALARGENPCISLDFNNLPWVTYTRNNSLFGSACDLAGQWHEFLIYHDDGLYLGPASFVCSNLRSAAGITQAPDMGYAVFAVRPTTPQFPTNCGLKFIAFDPAHESQGQHHYCQSFVSHSGDLIDTMPCIAKTPGDYLHIIWQVRRPTSGGQDSIMYTTPDGPTSPWAIRTENYPGFDSTPVRLALGDSLTSPFVDAYGDSAFATWADSLPWPDDCGAEVWRTSKLVSWPAWHPAGNWSRSPNQPSDYPTMSAGVLFWANDGCDYDHLDVRARLKLSDPPTTVYSGGGYAQTFLHADFQRPGNIARSVFRALFTELTPASTYAVRLAQYVDIPMDPGPFYSADIGDSSPSLFCPHRDGARQYDSCAVDYSDSLLRYRLLYLNPMYHYRARLIFYHEDTCSCKEVTTLNDSLPTTVAVPPLVHETLWLELPQNSYRDGRLNLSISKLTGADAELADLTVFQYESTSTGTGGGGQSFKTEPPRLEPSLNSASLFSGHVTISYALPSDTRVSLRVFDLSGRVVRVLQSARSGETRAGLHTAYWDGCDGTGRVLPAGVYFCRLETDSFRIGRKLVQTR